MADDERAKRSAEKIHRSRSEEKRLEHMATLEEQRAITARIIAAEYSDVIAERDRLKNLIEGINDWYGQRWQRLRELLREEAPEIEERAINVMANGAADTMESATRPSFIEQLTAERDRLAKQVERLERDANRYRAIRDSKHLSWGYDGRGGECVKSELPLAGEPIWKDENDFDFVASFDAAADKLVAALAEQPNA